MHSSWAGAASGLVLHEEGISWWKQQKKWCVEEGEALSPLFLCLLVCLSVLLLVLYLDGCSNVFNGVKLWYSWKDDDFYCWVVEELVCWWTASANSSIILPLTDKILFSFRNSIEGICIVTTKYYYNPFHYFKSHKLKNSYSTPLTTLDIK